MKKISIEPFWGQAGYDSVSLKKKVRNNSVHTVYSGTVNFDTKIKMDLLDKCWDKTTLRCGLSFKNSFFYSIKQYVGKANTKKYEKFRAILESRNLIRSVFLLTNKEYKGRWGHRHKVGE